MEHIKKILGEMLAELEHQGPVGIRCICTPGLPLPPEGQTVDDIVDLSDLDPEIADVIRLGAQSKGAG